MMTEFFCPTNPYYENESGLYNGKFWIRKSMLTTRGGKLQRDGSEEKSALESGRKKQGEEEVKGTRPQREICCPAE
jgi:hypothetical protein